MAKVIHFVVLAIVTIISMGSYGEVEATCHAEPLKPFITRCVSDASKPRSWEDMLCTFTSSGIISTNGELKADRFKELFKPWVIEGKQTHGDAFMAAVRICAEEVGSGKTPKEAFAALQSCTMYWEALNQYLLSVCQGTVI